MLNLEGAQAGLSWLTILQKREGYRRAFDRFDAKKIVKYDAKKRNQLLQNPGIVRNRLKINAVIENAKAFLEVQREFGSFDKYIWSFVGGKPIRGGGQPGFTPVSDAMSKDLKKRGFKFVGTTRRRRESNAWEISDPNADRVCSSGPKAEAEELQRPEAPSRGV
jgi:DNA-3-methyladenine glycosylase I